jgi:hypothetical protein
MKEKKILKQIYFSAVISLQGIIPCFSYEKVRYCQIFLGPNIPNLKIYQMITNYTKWSCNTYTNIYHSKAPKNLPKFGIFGLKPNHLATLV